MEDLTQGWAKLGPFFQVQDTFLEFQKRSGEPSPKILLYLIYWLYAKDKTSLNYANLISPNKCGKDDKIILKCSKYYGEKNSFYV